MCIDTYTQNLISSTPQRRKFRYPASGRMVYRVLSPPVTVFLKNSAKNDNVLHGGDDLSYNHSDGRFVRRHGVVAQWAIKEHHPCSRDEIFCFRDHFI